MVKRYNIHNVGFYLQYHPGTVGGSNRYGASFCLVLRPGVTGEIAAQMRRFSLHLQGICLVCTL